VLDVRRPSREQAFELAAADQTEIDLRSLPRRLEDRLHPLQRDQLADEERDEAVRRRPARLEEPVLRADEGNGHVGEPCETGEEPRVRCGIRDDNVGGAKCAAVDGFEDARCKRARAEPPSVADQRVSE